MRTRAVRSQNSESYDFTLHTLSKIHSDGLRSLKFHVIVALTELHEFLSLAQGWYKHLWCNLDHKESATNDECNTSGAARNPQLVLLGKPLPQQRVGRKVCSRGPRAERGSRSWSERPRIPRAALSTMASSARARPGGSAARSSTACRGWEPQPAAGTKQRRDTPRINEASRISET